MTKTVNIRDINPLEHITSDLAKAHANYESILNGLVAWNASDNDVITVRLATDSAPGFVDYTFPTRKAYVNNSSLFISYDTAGNGCFDVDNRLTLPVTPGGTGVYSDEVNLRLSVTEGRGYRWNLFADLVIRDEPDLTNASRNYASGDYVYSSGMAYIVSSPVSAGDSLEGNVQPHVVAWQAGTGFMRGTIAYTAGQTGGRYVYMLRGHNGTTAPENDTTNWLRIGEVLDDIAIGEPVEHGKAYVYIGDDSPVLYIYRGRTVARSEQGPVPAPDHPADRDWYGPAALEYVDKVTDTTVVRFIPSVDTRGFIMACRDTGTGQGSVYVSPSVSYKAPPAEPHRGLKVFDTANFSRWPESNSPAWQEGHVYGYDDDYSAKMVFHHADPATKTANIVNYDGPDLDRGLCIYLPVSDTASDNGSQVTVEPKDGAMIEFMFRIWPRTELNGRESADLIVNKAQIYVYSVPDSSSLDSGKVIAKFSMARVTNFYVWAENVAIPNRPVFYKARFIYSGAHREWKTYDYYQIPDHVFLAPKGFVDPSLRLYADDGVYPGLETAGFPLMQDPFGGMDLSRIRLNRIEEDEPVVTEPPEESSEEETDPGE